MPPRSSASLPPTATKIVAVLSTPAFAPTMPPAPDDSCANQVVIHVSTTVVIQDYALYYPETPIQSFNPTYVALPDGSLLLPPTQTEFQRADPLLLLAGGLVMLFLRNTLVSADYIRRGRVKHKGLFYALFVSQLLGLVGSISTAVVFVSPSINCKIAILIGVATTQISISLLATGILGIKAYRCLNRSKFVLAGLTLCQLTVSGLLLSEIPHLHSSHGLTGACTAPGGFNRVPIAILVRFFESTFICACFMYALWKSWKIPTAQGRLVLRRSNFISENEESEKTEEQRPGVVSRSRGWWDYVPEEHAEPQLEQRGHSETESWVLTEDQGFFRNIRFLFCGSQRQGKPANRLKRSSRATQEELRTGVQISNFNRSPLSPSHRLSQLMKTPMAMFREVMKTELGNAAVSTLGNVAAAILSLIAVFDHNLLLSPIYFISGNWAITSTLVMQSFAQVVARNEQEEFLRQAAASDPSFRADGILGSRAIRRRRTPPSRRSSEPDFVLVTPTPPRSRSESIDVSENPFADFEPVTVGSPADMIIVDDAQYTPPRRASWMLKGLEVP